MNNLYYLAHGGPGSGRYPLGSGDRPYQKFEGSGRKSSGISGYIKARKVKKEAAKQQKAQEEERRKQAEEEKLKKKREADKQRVLREGSPSEVARYHGELTNRELADVAERLRLEKQINSYASDEVRSNLSKLKKVQSYTNVGSALAKDGIEIWNSFAGIYNATAEGRKSPLPFVTRGGGGGKDKGKK